MTSRGEHRRNCNAFMAEKTKYEWAYEATYLEGYVERLKDVLLRLYQDPIIEAEYGDAIEAVLLEKKEEYETRHLRDLGISGFQEAKER